MARNTPSTDQIAELEAANHNDPTSDANQGHGEPTPKRTILKPGFERKFIHIPSAAWEKITAHVEANDLDLDRFLTRQLVKVAEGLDA